MGAQTQSLKQTTKVHAIKIMTIWKVFFAIIVSYDLYLDFLVILSIVISFFLVFHYY